MFTRYIIPAAALIGFLFAVRTVIVTSRPVIPANPVYEPASSSFQTYVSGAGMVEASTENIALSTNVPGVVTEVYVTAGQTVQAGTPLFKIDDRQEQANLNVLLAALEIARANLSDAVAQYELAQNLIGKKAVSTDEYNRKKYAERAAAARVSQAEAEVAATRTLLERLTVRSPINASVLQVKIRTGEFAPAGVLQTPLMILGDTSVLHVRVDVDENDAWRVSPEAKAEAFLRGNPEIKTPATFVRLEPYVIPKRSLTGESSERVDTRVLQIIYRIDKQDLPVFAGQLMDVYIEVHDNSVKSDRQAGSYPGNTFLR